MVGNEVFRTISVVFGPLPARYGPARTEYIVDFQCFFRAAMGPLWAGPDRKSNHSGGLPHATCMPGLKRIGGILFREMVGNEVFCQFSVFFGILSIFSVFLGPLWARYGPARTENRITPEDYPMQHACQVWSGLVEYFSVKWSETNEVWRTDGQTDRRTDRRTDGRRPFL
jgi:hypothetical protein